MNRRLLIVSPHFPPINAPDHQRVRMSLPYFRENGWDVEVLTVDPDSIEVAREPELVQTVPAEIPVHRVPAYSSRWTRRLGVGNLGYRSWLQLNSAGARLLKEKHFDLVYFSTTQHIVSTLGRRWRKKFGVPFVVDVQDPWRTDFYERPGSPPPPGGWKYRFARWQANRLEERSWQDAAGFVSVSPRYLEDLGARYSWFAAKPSAVIPFGAPEADFERVRNDPSIQPAFSREPHALHVVSVGAVGPIMRPALEVLFGGLASLRRRDPSSVLRLRMHFIGTSYAPADRAEQSVEPLAAAAGVGDLVRESVERVGYFTAIKTMLAADALILIASNDSGYSPSKIGPCFLAQRPVLALAAPGSVAAQRISELKFASLVPISEPPARARVALFLQELLFNPVPSKPPFGRDDARFMTEETARACTVRQCELFARALNQTG
jgi:hypothetical protein